MRRLVIPIALMLAVPALHAEPASAVRIAELLPDPGADREFIELWNPMDVEAVVSGWTIEDAAGNRFTLPDWTLPPGGRMVVWGGGEADGYGPAWNRSSVWNNGGDEALLRDAAGIEVDRFAYGDHPDATVPAPATGQSLQWDDGWIDGGPTPGRPAGADGGTAEVQVADEPPAAAFIEPPDVVRPGAEVVLGFHAQDANGDPLDWTLDWGHGTDAGNTSGDQERNVTAPLQEGPWAWTLSVASAGATRNAEWSVDVRASPLRILVPDGGLSFPVLHPGDRDVRSSQAFTVRNDGDATVVPRIDVSPFRGAQTDIAVVDNLHFRIEDVSVSYEGPLTGLPALPAGASYDVVWIIDRVPDVLAAGPYGTSFTVVT